MALFNDSDTWFGLDADDQVVEGESNPAARTVLLAPGGSIDEVDAERYGIADRLTPLGSVKFVGHAGEEVVVRGNRAVAADLGAPPKNRVVPERGYRTRRAVEAERAAAGAGKADRTAAPETKAVRAGEDKAAADDEEAGKAKAAGAPAVTPAPAAPRAHGR